MTYIVAVQLNGFTAMVSDTRVTFKHEGIQWGSNTALKTGRLFLGCIFARAGDDDHSLEFVRAAKSFVSGTRSLEGFWGKFEQFAASYVFPTVFRDQFEMVISSRALGPPRLYKLDCNQGLAPVSANAVTIGAGKPSLDSFVLKCGIPLMHQLLAKNQLPSPVAPYTLCLLLTEAAQGIERPTLERKGVGGIFHFIYQTANGEGRQKPALYILSLPDFKNKNLYSWMYRVAFSQSALVVETLTPPGQTADAPGGKSETVVLLETSTSSFSREELAYRKGKIIEEINAQPSYWFCGSGAINPDHRNSRLIHIANNGQCVVAKDGQVSQKYSDFIISDFVRNMPDENI